MASRPPDRADHSGHALAGALRQALADWFAGAGALARPASAFRGRSLSDAGARTRWPSGRATAASGAAAAEDPAHAWRLPGTATARCVPSIAAQVRRIAAADRPREAGWRWRSRWSPRTLAAVAGAGARRSLEKSERLQQALYEIADLAGSDLEMADMLRRIHAVVGRPDVRRELLHRAVRRRPRHPALPLLRRPARHLRRRPRRAKSPSTRCPTA